jgi:hypothetical protein
MFRNHLSVLAAASVSFVLLHHSQAATFQEDFASDPLKHGWKVVGQTNLIQWNTTNQNLAVTWDSSQPNTYFCRPLGTLLTKEDDFSLTFELRLDNFLAGANPQKAGPFQLTVGLINLAEATQTNFLRGTGADSPNLIEFSFFPDPGGAWQWGPSLTSTLIDWTGTNWSWGGFAPLGLSTNDSFVVTLQYTATNQTLHTTLLRNGQPFGSVSDASPSSDFLDFRVDHLAVCSYSDAGQDPAYAGSIFAQGTVDNVVLDVPRPISSISGQFTDGHWQSQFLSRSNWLYTLERTADFLSWTAASPATAGNGGTLSLADTNAPGAKAFYRVKALRL